MFELDTFDLINQEKLLVGSYMVTWMCLFKYSVSKSHPKSVCPGFR